MQIVQNRDGQRRSFSRICSRAELVEETQAALIHILQDIHDGCHMRGESGQTLLYALLIADIGIDFIKQRDLTAVACRNMKSSHTHQLKETDGL